MWPRLRPMFTYLRIERPTSETLRPCSAAASATCWTRWMFDAEQVLVELRPHHPDRQRPAVDGRHARRADLARDERQRADVVFVPVRQHDRLDVVRALAQVGEVGQNEVDAELLGCREREAGVD